MALVATCTAGVADVTEAASATVTESDNGAMIVALSSTFSKLTVLIALLVVIVVLVTMANKKLKSKSVWVVTYYKISYLLLLSAVSLVLSPIRSFSACNIENLGMDL